MSVPGQSNVKNKNFAKNGKYWFWKM